MMAKARGPYRVGPLGHKQKPKSEKPPKTAQQEPVAIFDAEFMRKVLSVAIAGLYYHNKNDVLRVFMLEDLQTVVDLSESLLHQQVEDIYRRAWDMLAAPQPAQQEPVVRWDSDGWGDLLVDSLPDGTLLYTSPPAQRTWVNLTAQETASIAECVYGSAHHDDITFATEIQTKLKEKNT